jgi:hypothetical protein
MNRAKRNFALIMTISLLLLSSLPTSLGSNSENDDVLVTFTEVTSESGFSLVNTGPETVWSSYGPGTSVDDCDGDGDMDVIVTARFDHITYETEAHFDENTNSTIIDAAIQENSTGNTQFMVHNGDGTFTDMTDHSGLKLVNTTVIGASWADYDNDGDKDVYLSNFGRTDVYDIGSGAKNYLFQNNGDCVFTDVTSNTGLGQGALGQPVIVDGVVTAVEITDSGSGYASTGGLSPAVFIRGGDGIGAIADVVVTNGKVTSVSIIEGGEGYDDNNPPIIEFVSGVGNFGHSTTAIWADYDHDGDLDLYSMNLGIVDEEKFWARTETNFLYRNDGDVDNDGEIEFSDVTKEAGVSGQTEVSDSANNFYISNLHRMDQASPSNPSTMAQIDTADYHGSGLSFAGVWFDYDGDGWEDLYVASDFGISPIYHNEQDGTFSIVTDELQMDIPGTGMGAHAGDWDRDGDMDLCHSNFGPNYLWQNENGTSFTENGDNMGFRDFGGGTSFVAVNWACQFFDYDLDGDLDIFFGVGRINRFAAYNNNTFFRNEGDTNGDGITEFTEISSQIGLGGSEKTMGTSIFDYDGDGDLDILLGQSGHSPQLFSNNAVQETDRHWLKVKLNGLNNEVTDFNLLGEKAYSNKYGTGCLVTVTLDDGTKMQQHVYAGSGYLGSNEPTVHFGLGDYESAKSVEVLWSTGITQKVNNVDADQVLVIEESTSIFFTLLGLTISETQGALLCLVLLMMYLLGNKFGLFNKEEQEELVSEKLEEE